MAKKNRRTLKAYFEAGRLPSGDQFGDLIDSMLNVIDEGFDKSAEDGFKVAQLGDTGKLISFFENIAVKSPLWSIRVDLNSRNLMFESQAPAPSTDASHGAGPASPRGLSLSPTGKVGVNKKTPVFELDVEGTASLQGRIGGRRGQIPADGKWHDILEGLDGCRAFEIMAGAGKRKAGKYALLHAVALNTFNGKGTITHHQARYASRCDRLKLRWTGEAHNYRLQLRTLCNYADNVEDNVYVTYYITDLWPDPKDWFAAAVHDGQTP